MIARMTFLKMILFVYAFTSTLFSNACSMYKVTVDGKTMVGNNEDAWRTTPHIWFETAKNGNYGCCFVGSREIRKNKYAAQSGMNEHGLTFSRLASYHPKQENSKAKQLKLIENPDLFLMDIMHSCKNIDEVYALLNQYDRSPYLQDVFVYVEPSGDYLVVEPYRLIRGSDPSYVQANFCPSITSESERRNQKRYRDGRDLLNKKIDTSLEFCTQLSKQMHVCRDKIVDGTLLTTIWNTSDLTFNVFFYHDYANGMSFNLKEELAKGDHQLSINELFSENEEFEELKTYITPFNTPWLRFALAFVGFFFLISGIYFIISAMRSSRPKRLRSIYLVMSFTLFASFVYLFFLATTINVYYFPSPYQSSSIFESTASFIPYFISGLLLILGILAWRKKESFSLSFFTKGLILVNALALIGVFIGIFYWKLF